MKATKMGLKVCITGDVHHYLGQLEEEREEYKFAEEYQNIVEKHGTSSTYFVTGKCIEQHREFWREFSSRAGELGGHTYWAFQPKIVGRINNKLFGSVYGPRLYQWLDIRKSLDAFKSIGLEMKCWRTHAYRRNVSAYSFLKKAGVKIISDKRQENLQILNENGLIYVPITCLPDDKIHKIYTEGDLIEMKYEWRRIEENICSDISEKKDIVLNLHPICMKLLDNFHSFESLIIRFKENDYQFCTISELVGYYDRCGKIPKI